MLAKLLVICAAAAVAHGYSSGAPLSPEICESLTPKHPGAPQTGPFPYVVTTDLPTVQSGGIVVVNVSATEGVPFKGFILQGRNADFERDAKPQGKFIVDDNREQVQGLHCGEQFSSVTHSSAEEKQHISLKWLAPQKKGTYVILATVVQSGKVYWVRQPSPQITVV